MSDDMRAQLRTMLGPTGSVLRQSHLVRFFDAWKAGDYTSAFDNLHRYYDYTMQTREKSHYQFALLHMAILHADFGCFSEAIAAINETISMARENQDMQCLNFSLSWLNHMSKAYPQQMKGAGYMGMLGSERDGLTFLKAKAKETKTYYLLSNTLLNEAQLCMSSVSHITNLPLYPAKLNGPARANPSLERLSTCTKPHISTSKKIYPTTAPTHYSNHLFTLALATCILQASTWISYPTAMSPAVQSTNVSKLSP